jgi:hypothetical protein
VTEEGEDFSDSVELSSVVRSAYVMAHVGKFLDVLDQADMVYANLPKIIRDELSLGYTREESCVKAKLAIAFAQIDPETRTNYRTMLEEVRNYVGVWLDDGDQDAPEAALYGMLSDVDISVIEQMITFIQKVGPKSTRQLLQFLESANEGDYSFLLIQSAGRSNEIRMRHDAPDATRAHFGIE